MTNSRNKGASFEREVANLLTKDLNLKNNIRRIRPGYGMKPKYYEEMIGKEVKKDIEAGSPLLREDIK